MGSAVSSTCLEALASRLVLPILLPQVPNLSYPLRTLPQILTSVSMESRRLDIPHGLLVTGGVLDDDRFLLLTVLGYLAFKPLTQLD